jgi:hypothetical protein
MQVRSNLYHSTFVDIVYCGFAQEVGLLLKFYDWCQKLQTLGEMPHRVFRHFFPHLAKENPKLGNLQLVAKEEEHYLF